MKKIKCAAIFAMAISTLLVACEDYDGAVVQTLTERPPPPPLAWDETDWDDALWQ